MTRLLSIAFCVLCLSACGTTARPTVGSVLHQPLLVPILYQGQEDYQLVQAWPVPGYDEIIPKGLVVDGASVPRLLWPFMPPDGLHRGGALFHDWGYIRQGHLQNGMLLTKRQMDQAFYNLMVQAGVSERRAGIAYQAVNHFGYSAWDSIEQPVILPVSERALMMSRQPRSLGLFRHLYAP